MRSVQTSDVTWKSTYLDRWHMGDNLLAATLICVLDNMSTLTDCVLNHVIESD